MDIIDIILARFNYWVYIIIMMIGLYAMISKNNLVKKLIGMSIFQTAIILFYVSIGVKHDATIPILTHDAAHGHHAEVESHGVETAQAHHFVESQDISVEAPASGINPDEYANPLPHVLMLTAILVGVATLGVGLAVVQRVYLAYNTLEEDEILARIRASDG